MNIQLNILEAIEQEVRSEKPYRNALGELLPWEKPDYLDMKAQEVQYEKYRR